MGNSVSKKMTKPVNKAIVSQPNSSFNDESFGKSIMKNIRLKETSFTPVTADISSSIKQRNSMNQKTDGTVTWDNFRSLLIDELQLPDCKIEKDKLDQLRKHFALPNK
jgi:hypothetical protein